MKMLERYDEAYDFYSQAIKLNEQNAAAWENRGVINALAGDLISAEQDLLRATALVGVETVADCETAWRNLGSLQLLRGRTEAAQSMARAFACNKADPWSSVIRARLHLQLDGHVDPRKAFLDAEVANRHVEHKGFGFARLARRVYAISHLRNGRPAEAVHYAQLAIEASDIPAINYLIIAISEADLGHSAAAQAALDRALQSWPPDLAVRGGYVATAPEGVLWFETADELLSLRKEAEAPLAAQP